MADLNLLAGRPPVIGEEVAAAELDSPIDEAAEVIGGLALAGIVVIDMQVHDRACPRLPSPRHRGVCEATSTTL